MKVRAVLRKATYCSNLLCTYHTTNLKVPRTCVRNITHNRWRSALHLVVCCIQVRWVKWGQSANSITQMRHRGHKSNKKGPRRNNKSIKHKVADRQKTMRPTCSESFLRLLCQSSSCLLLSRLLFSQNFNPGDTARSLLKKNPGTSELTLLVCSATHSA